jgi:ankyrin repeat protein
LDTIGHSGQMVASQLSHFQTLSIPDRTSAQPCAHFRKRCPGLQFRADPSIIVKTLRLMDFPRLFVFLAVLLTVPLLTSCDVDSDSAREQLANMRVQYSEADFLKRVQQGDVLVVNLFLAAGMDPNVAEEGKTGLMLAAANGYTTIARALVSRGAKTNTSDFAGRTPLMMAAMNGDIDTMKLLLSEGANLEAQDNYGCTVLMIAAAEGQTGTVEFLLTKRTNMKARDKGGRTALIWAAMRGRTNTAEVLIGNGDDMNAQDKNGCTALIMAAWEGYAETAWVLYKNGADPNLKDTKYQRTATMWAKAGNHPKVAEMLAPLEKPAE